MIHCTVENRRQKRRWNTEATMLWFEDRYTEWQQDKGREDVQQEPCSWVSQRLQAKQGESRWWRGRRWSSSESPASRKARREQMQWFKQPHAASQETVLSIVRTRLCLVEWWRLEWGSNQSEDILQSRESASTNHRPGRSSTPSAPPQNRPHQVRHRHQWQEPWAVTGEEDTVLQLQGAPLHCLPPLSHHLHSRSRLQCSSHSPCSCKGNWEYYNRYYFCLNGFIQRVPELEGGVPATVFNIYSC